MNAKNGEVEREWVFSQEAIKETQERSSSRRRKTQRQNQHIHNNGVDSTNSSAAVLSAGAVNKSHDVAPLSQGYRPHCGREKAHGASRVG